MKEPDDGLYGWVKGVGMLMQVPLILGLAPVTGCAIGWLMDKFLGTSPIFTIVLLFLGFVAGIVEMWKILQRASAKDNEE